MEQNQERKVEERRRIFAVFQPQAWIDDNATDIDGPKDVDVTDRVIGLSLDQLHALQDYRDTTDNLVEGTAVALEHKGPFTVCAVDSVCEFFGVEELSEITEDMLSAARKSAQSKAGIQEGAPQTIERFNGGRNRVIVVHTAQSDASFVVPSGCAELDTLRSEADAAERKAEKLITQAQGLKIRAELAKIGASLVEEELKQLSSPVATQPKKPKGASQSLGM